MSAIVIKSDSPSNIKILKELAEKLGSSVASINEEQAEDLLFGKLMESEKTGTLVDRDTIFKKLNRLSSE